MIDIIINSASAILMGAGSIFILIGALGLVRLPDFYTRMHAAGVTDTLGAELLLLGMMLQAGLSLVTLKLVLISLFIFFTSPTSTHAVDVVPHAPRVDDKAGVVTLACECCYAPLEGPIARLFRSIDHPRAFAQP